MAKIWILLAFIISFLVVIGAHARPLGNQHVLYPVIPAVNLTGIKGDFLRLDDNPDTYLMAPFKENEQACLTKFVQVYAYESFNVSLDFTAKDDGIAYVVKGEHPYRVIKIKGKITYECESKSVERMLNNNQKGTHYFILNESDIDKLSEMNDIIGLLSLS